MHVETPCTKWLDFLCTSCEMDDVKPFHNFNQVLHLGCSNDYCAQCTCAEGIQLVRVCICMCVYLCVCMSRLCYSDFLKVAKNQALMNAVQAQHGNTSNIIVFNFWIKALFINFMAWFAYLKHRCGAFQTTQKTNLLTAHLLATWINTTGTAAYSGTTQ